MKNSFGSIAAAALAIFCAGANASPASDPLGERAVLGRHLSRPMLQVTVGEDWLEDVSARVSNATVVHADGSAQVDVKFGADATSGNASIAIDASGRAGENFMGVATLNGQSVPIELSVARVEGCEKEICPGAVRATIHRRDGFDLNLHIPASN
jgi:hypothetical protein